MMLELWGLINLRHLLNEYKIHLFAPFIFLIVNFFHTIALSKGCILTVFGEIDPLNFPSLRTVITHPTPSGMTKKKHLIICSPSWSPGMRHLECVAHQPDSSLRIWNSQSIQCRKACKSSSRCALG